MSRTGDQIVHYHTLRPRDLVRRRTENPVAYLGVGILEWHGVHNPLGLDGIKADLLCRHMAQELGGVVMPPLYWGDHRAEICELVFDPEVSPWLPEGTQDHTAGIEREMAVPKSALEADADRGNQEGGWSLFHDLVRHIIFQVEALQFRNLIIIPGHYPLIGQVDLAVTAFRESGGSMEVLVLTDHMYDNTGEAGDHAAAFETSVLMALQPELVDLEELGPASQPAVGVLGDDPRTHAGATFGWRIVSRLTDVAKEWLEHQ